jgi:exopolysaccharide production protein ExoZ
MRQKFLTIQYLRGFAAMTVLTSHALIYPLVEEDLTSARLGWLGVVLFFVISGFIMVAVTGEGTFSARDFLRRRVVRIVPMYWAATLLAGGLALFAPHIFKSTIFNAGQLLESLLFIPFYNDGSHGIHPIYKLGWTLNYEMFFYVCFALLAFLSAGRRVIVLTLAFTLLAIIGLVVQPEAAIPKFYTGFMPLAFCAGAWLGLATLRGRIAKLSSRIMFVTGIVGAAGLVEGIATNHDNFVYDGMAFIGLVIFATATVTLAVRYERQIPRFAFLEKLGDASYSIYLAHIYVVAIVSHIAFTFLDPMDFWANDLVAAICIVGGTIAGLLLYRLVEKPLLDAVNAMMGSKRRPKSHSAPTEPARS